MLQYFLVPLVLKNGTGEPGGTTLFFNLYLYQTFFTFQNMSYGATLAWLLFAITLLVTLRPVPAVAGAGSTTRASADRWPRTARSADPTRAIRGGSAGARTARRAGRRASGVTGRRSFLLTLIAIVGAGAVPLADAPLGRGLAVKSTDQIAQPDSPLWPADPRTFEYEGEALRRCSWCRCPTARPASSR